jgi:hypothetical protein
MVAVCTHHRHGQRLLQRYICYLDAEYFNGAANMRRVTVVFVRLVREVDMQAAGSRNRRLGNLDHAVVFGQ